MIVVIATTEGAVAAVRRHIEGCKTAQIRVERSRWPTRGACRSPFPNLPPYLSVGDTFAVTWVRPGLLHVTAITAREPSSSFGIPHLCGVGLAAEDQILCGA